MENSCKNCKHFTQHYIINKYNHIRPVNCGVCTAQKITLKEKKRFPFAQACELWELNEATNKEQKHAIEEDLREMINHINEILQILKAD